MNKRKTLRVLVKETFIKTLDERYAESTKNEKVFYWITIAIAVAVLLFT